MRFAFFCKSFGPDLPRVARLLDSVRLHDRSGCPFVLSVPRRDRELFVNRFGTSEITLLTDEEILGRDLQQGWRTQQLVKLYAAQVDFADAWMLLDSDFYLIRAFRREEFVSDGRVAFMVSVADHCFDDNPALIQGYLADGAAAQTPSEAECGSWRSAHAPGRLPCATRLLDKLRRPPVNATPFRIQRFFQRGGPYLYFMAGPVWTRESVLRMQSDWLEPNGLSFEDLIAYAPWEAVWVGEWELSRGLPERRVLPLPVLHFRSDEAIRRARALGITEARLASRYLGIALAARHQDLLRLDA